MLVNERQNEIYKYLQKHGSATVKTLAETFYVSEATLRRDLAEMQRLGLAERSHGGATLPEGAGEISVTNALKSLPNFFAAFIDSSSTALALVRKIDFRGKTVVTHSLQVATAVSRQKGAEVILAGGNLLYNMTSVSGSFAVEQIRQFSFDLTLTSCAAIAADGTYERSMEQREIKRAAIARGKTNFLIADHTKFSCFAPFRAEELSAFDKIVLDAPPPEELFSSPAAPPREKFVY